MKFLQKRFAEKWSLWEKNYWVKNGIFVKNVITYLRPCVVVILLLQRFPFVLELVAELHKPLRLFDVSFNTGSFGFVDEFVDLFGQKFDGLVVPLGLSS